MKLFFSTTDRFISGILKPTAFAFITEDGKDYFYGEIVYEEMEQELRIGQTELSKNEDRLIWLHYKGHVELPEGQVDAPHLKNYYVGTPNFIAVMIHNWLKSINKDETFELVSSGSYHHMKYLDELFESTGGSFPDDLLTSNFLNINYLISEVTREPIKAVEYMDKITLVDKIIQDSATSEISNFMNFIAQKNYSPKALEKSDTVKFLYFYYKDKLDDNRIDWIKNKGFYYGDKVLISINNGLYGGKTGTVVGCAGDKFLLLLDGKTSVVKVNIKEVSKYIGE